MYYTPYRPISYAPQQFQQPIMFGNPSPYFRGGFPQYSYAQPQIYNSVGFNRPTLGYPYGYPQYPQIPQVPQVPYQSVPTMQSQMFASPQRSLPIPTSPQRNPLMQSQQMQSPSKGLSYQEVQQRIQQQQPQNVQQPKLKQQPQPQPQAKPQQNQHQPYQQQATPKQPQQQQLPQQQQYSPDDLDQRYQNAIQNTQEITKKYGQQQEEPRNNEEEQEDDENDDKQTEIALQYEDGFIYRGLGFKPSKRHGFGVLTDEEGNEVYQGEWEEDLYHGMGKLSNLNVEEVKEPIDWNNLTQIGNAWITYEGNFAEGKMQGMGRLTLSNGEIYEGEFEDGTINGNGEYTTQDGKLIKGLWENGFLLNFNE